MATTDPLAALGAVKIAALRRAAEKDYQGLTPEEHAAVAEARAVQKFQPTSLTDFVEATLAEPRWAVEGIWPEGASGVIAGRPKDGKSTLAVELAVSLWSGTPMFGHSFFPARSRPAPVLYVQQENANTRVQRDLQMILAARGLGQIEHEIMDVLAPDGSVVEETFSSFVLDPMLGFYWSGWNKEPPAFEVLSQAGFDLSEPADRAWLQAHIVDRGFGYVFLDPLYMLIGVVDEKDSAPLKPILSWLTGLRNETGCAVVLTHHMSDKGGGNDASSLLGSTYIHGWYEAALLTRRADPGTFTVKVDAQRDFGTTKEHILQGLGVGRWFYAPEAQGQTDALGKSAPRVAAKLMNIERLRHLHAEHPEWSYEQFGNELGVKEKTVQRYFKELRDGGGDA